MAHMQSASQVVALWRNGHKPTYSFANGQNVPLIGMRVLVRFAGNEFYYGNIISAIELIEASVVVVAGNTTRKWKLSIMYTDGDTEEAFFPDNNGDVHVIFDSLNDTTVSRRTKPSAAPRDHVRRHSKRPPAANPSGMPGCSPANTASFSYAKEYPVTK